MHLLGPSYVRKHLKFSLKWFKKRSEYEVLLYFIQAILSENVKNLNMKHVE